MYQNYPEDVHPFGHVFASPSLLRDPANTLSLGKRCRSQAHRIADSCSEVFVSIETEHKKSVLFPIQFREACAAMASPGALPGGRANRKRNSLFETNGLSQLVIPLLECGYGRQV